MRLRRIAGVAGVALGVMLGVGVPAAEASTPAALVGAVSDTNTATGYTSGTVAVATQNTASGWFAYTPAYYSNELTAISMANPAAPAIAGEGAPPGNQLEGADTVNIFGGIAYVVSKNQNGACSGTVGGPTCDVNDRGTGNALSLFDVSTNPSSPAYLGSIQDTSDGGGSNGISDGGKALFGAYGVTVTNINGTPYALVAAQGCLSGQPCPDSTVGNDLAVINVSVPSAPTLAGSVANVIGPTFNNDLLHPTSVAVSGHYAYVTSFYGDALTVVDISNPTNPTVVRELQNTSQFPYPSDVAIQGNYAYVTNQNGSTTSPGTLTVVDISNPTSPKVVSTTSALGLSGGYRIRVSGDFAYVSASNVASITPVDISNPAAPYVLPSVVSSAQLHKTTGLDLMNMSGSEYVVAASPYLSTQSNHTFPTYPAPGNSAQVNTGTISAIQLDPAANTPVINPASEPSTSGQPFTTATSASFSFATGDLVSTVACSLDGSAYAPCTSLTTANYSGLALGQHTFTLQATDAAGNNSTASYTWTIQAPSHPPTASFTDSVVTPVPAIGSPVSFKSTSSAYGTESITASSWNFGDGTTGTGTSISHTYSAAGTYTVTLTVTQTDGQTAQTSATVTVDAPPTSGFTWSPSSPTAASALSFQSTSSPGTGAIASYNWSFGDGATSTSASPTHTYATPGTYSVTLTVTQSDGLSATAQKSITVAQPAPANTALPVVSGSAVVGGTLTASPGTWDWSPTSYHYQWQRCDALGANCVHLPATTATYHVGSTDVGFTLQVVVTATNGTGSTSVTSAATSVVTQSAGGPIPGFTDSTLTAVPAAGSPVAFTSTSSAYTGESIISTDWDFGDGTTATGPSVAHIYSAPGTYVVTLTVTQTDGQTAHTTARVTVDDPPSVAFAWNPTAPSAGAATTFVSVATAGGGSITGYSWNFGDGTTSNTANPTHTYTAAGTYLATLTVVQPDGLTATVQHSITVSAATTPIVPANPNGPNKGGKGKQTTIWLAHALAASGSPKITSLINKDGVSDMLSAPSSPGHITIVWYATVAHHRIVVARGAAALKTSGRSRLEIHLTEAGRRLLAKSKAVRITISGVFRSTAANVSAVRTLTVRR